MNELSIGILTGCESEHHLSNRGSDLSKRDFHRIGILTGCASDRHLSEPIYNELKKLDMNPYFLELTQNNINDSYHKANYCFKQFNYDFVLAVGDRREQIGGVIAAFDNNISIGHLYSGDLSTGVSDDLHRAAITLYSNIQFCSCIESTENTIRLMRSAGLVPDANYVGSTHLNNIDISKLTYSNAYIEPYALISVNSEMKGNDEKLIEETLVVALSCAYPINYIITKGNNDSKNIEDLLFKALSMLDCKVVKQSRVSQTTYLSQIKHCKYFITNSSSATYEAPFLMNPNNILIVGKRNKERTRITDLAHDGLASIRVADLIKTFLEAKK